MPTSPLPTTWFLSVSLLAYSAALAGIAGFINSVALLVWAFPVGNLTALTTQAGMHSTYPLLYQGRMIAAIVGGFFLGATTASAVLAATRTITSHRHAAILVTEAALLVAAAGIEHPLARAAIAAGACGLQNAMSSNFPGMPIRTTHFTGTITDLALLLGRSSRHGLDKPKATLLTTTVVLFIAGAAAGVLLGNRIGDHALIPPAAATLALATAITMQHRRHNSRLACVTVQTER
ncbi:hypothetical protein MKUB_00400 [Mycobacterium kubicae]|uniref:DUF1275 domain-containing protein n=1 Tax=Mycobacterium kubicae TaxID=120959 RepID=A0AAX1JCL9_9MYCO|nr:YoaK family protein [Mycobacterium kubicae]MCV7095374.1 DUF1275 domain-containing protein [Mycobacterium kubicae]ORW05843.1 hypothetical protein AWC13_24600 [Mycobacterium kubicae]QNI09987.1 DUF1275 domain-containing protein [Mycobacterium kubicae]QPI38189.1 DUF1275 domain-containing protein [Mycobacterium kubicae]GFG62550.1 hypothetical protein MKUB_00400 [Mycobacterium kubicae]